MDPIAQFKEGQKQAWSTFAPTELYTCQPAARLVAYAQIQAGHQQVGDESVLKNRNVRVFAHSLVHRALDFPAGFVGVVNDAIAAMPTFLSECPIRKIDIFVEPSA